MKGKKLIFMVKTTKKNRILSISISFLISFLSTYVISLKRSNTGNDTYTIIFFLLVIIPIYRITEFLFTKKTVYTGVPSLNFIGPEINYGDARTYITIDLIFVITIFILFMLAGVK